MLQDLSSSPIRIKIGFFVTGAAVDVDVDVTVTVGVAIDLVEVFVEAENHFGQKWTSVWTRDAGDSYRFQRQG